METQPSLFKKPSKKLKSFGPVEDLEKYVYPDWWNRIFNSLYLKTDGDVVSDENITKKEIDYFSKILNLSPDSKILDLCCGQGRHSLELARRGFKFVEGLDRSSYLIQKAKQQAKRENLSVKFREGDARKLPYPPDTFDFVLLLGNSFGYFEDLHDDILILKEIFRVLKPWGKILIDLADGEYLKNNFQKRSWEWIDKKHFVCRERSLSADEEKLISREVITHIEKGVIADQFYAERLYTEEKIYELLAEQGFVEIKFHGKILTESERDQDLGMMERRIIVTASIRKNWTEVKIRKKPVYKNVVVILGDPTKPDKLKPYGIFDADDFYTIDQLKAALKEIEKETHYSFQFLSNHNTLVTDLIELKQKNKIDFVFNLCDEGFLNDAEKELHIPALLDVLGIPYTGSSPKTLAYCYDKSLVRGIAKEMGIPVPDAFFVKPEDNMYEIKFSFPVIVKPNFGDSSFGITKDSVCYNFEELLNAISRIREKFGYEKPILIEEFLQGDDITVGIIGNTEEDYILLPIIKEDYSNLPKDLPRICGYEAKWLPTSPYWNIKSVLAELPDETEKFIIDCCLKLAERLECKDYYRFDWRLNLNNEPKLLEVNPNPGWCWDGHLAKMCKLANISYKDMLLNILKTAERRIANSKNIEVTNGNLVAV